MSAGPQYDAIIVGSGITGGWAAKELTERGLRVLMIERGSEVVHGQDYKTEHVPVQDMPYRLLGDQRRNSAEQPIQSQQRIFNEACAPFFINDRENPYTTEPGTSFLWYRGAQLGGKSLTWGRQSYRMAPRHFEENARDGHGVDWPIRYEDLAPWYDHVERFIGVSGTAANHPMLPDGIFQKAMPMNAVETDLSERLARLYPDRPLMMARMANLTEQMGDRAPCHYCGPCERGCSVGAYFSTQSSILPAARATGRLTVMTDILVEKLIFDAQSGRVTGVDTIDTKTRKKGTVTSRLVFLCASALESVRLLLNSRTDAMPNGLANSSGVLGSYVMDHLSSDMAIVEVDGPQIDNYTGYRPGPLVAPRFRNVNEERSDYVRGYQLFSAASPQGWARGARMKGYGTEFKRELRTSGPWTMFLVAMLECLPYRENRITIDPKVRDAWGVPVPHLNVRWGKNEAAMKSEAGDTVFEMLTQAGYADVKRIAMETRPGEAIHEMGGATMGRDRATSVLDAHNRAHDIPNLYVTDGAAMASSACVNPSLTYMALTARAAAHAAEAWKRGDV